MDYYKQTKKMFRRGDVIRIKNDSDLNLTDRNFTATDDMHRLKDEDMIVTEINHSTRTDAGCIHAAGFSWHPGDLYVIEHANEDPLINDGQEGVFVFDPQCL